MIQLLKDTPEPAFDIESWELCRKLRASVRIIVNDQRAILLAQRREIDAKLDALAQQDMELDTQEREAWRQRTGGFGLRVVK